MRPVLLVNAGSSSIKVQAFDARDGGLERFVTGKLEGIGSRPRLRVEGAGEEVRTARPA